MTLTKPMPPIRCIPYAKESAAFNMAADNFLFRHYQQPSFRVYDWQQPTLSLGKGNQTLFDINKQFCQKQNFSLVCRPTGGKSVFHDQEITYAFTFPAGIWSKSILRTYEALSLFVIKVLGTYINNLTLKREKSIHANHTNCFVDISAYEIKHQGKKLVGSAQARTAGAVLQHGSVLWQADWSKWSAVWQTNPITLQKHFTSFQEASKKKMDKERLIDHFYSAVANFFSCQTFVADWTKQEREQITQNEQKWSLDWLNV